MYPQTRGQSGQAARKRIIVKRTRRVRLNVSGLSREREEKSETLSDKDKSSRQ